MRKLIDDPNSILWGAISVAMITVFFIMLFLG